MGQATDKRLSYINNLLTGIRTIKSYLWETKIAASVERARSAEKSSYLCQFSVIAIGYGLVRNSQILMWIPLLLTPLAGGSPLVSSDVFSAVALLSGFCRTVIYFPFLAFNGAANYISVLKRVQEVLLLDEFVAPQISEEEGPRIVMKDFSASWDPDDLNEDAN